MEKYPILGEKLKNGITEYIYPVEGLEGDNFLALTVKVGSAAEKEDNAGIAHFVEHAQMSFFDEGEEDICVLHIQIFILLPFTLIRKAGGLAKLLS